MKQSTKFTPEYRKKLSANVKELTRYLESKTGYGTKISVQLDKELGYLYAVKLSLDNFETYSKWIIKSTSKNEMKREILESVSHFDFRNKKRGGTTKRVTKQVASTALKIECCKCGEEVEVPSSIHRNIKSDMFKARNGYVFCCHSCAVQQFSKILHESDIYTAFIWICAFYDRAYNKSLIDKIKALPLSPFNMAQEYFRQLNMVQYKGKLFVDSDISTKY